MDYKLYFIPSSPTAHAVFKASLTDTCEPSGRVQVMVGVGSPLALHISVCVVNTLHACSGVVISGSSAEGSWVYKGAPVCECALRVMGAV